jgi:hypothetical protein
MTRLVYAKNTVEALLILILLCTVLVGCPPRRPEPIVTQAKQSDWPNTQNQ